MDLRKRQAGIVVSEGDTKGLIAKRLFIGFSSCNRKEMLLREEAWLGLTHRSGKPVGRKRPHLPSCDL